MAGPVAMVEVHRGQFVESLHCGHAAVCGPDGELLRVWGDPSQVMLPRSACKMIQALPLVASGAADAFGLDTPRLALACASHVGAPMHVDEVSAWLGDLGLSERDLVCGPQASRDEALYKHMLCAGQPPRRVHNNCSGKHTGFLTLARHMRSDLDYAGPEHPVQKAVLSAFEEMTGQCSPGFAIDGCSAPNFATSLAGLARAMSRFATAVSRDDVLSRAAARLLDAMIACPDHVAGPGRAGTVLMRAAKEPVAVKSGAEGCYVAVLPRRGLGVAIKISDGAARASECAIAALLVHLGVLDRDAPEVLRFFAPPVLNWDGLVTGVMRPALSFPA